MRIVRDLERRLVESALAREPSLRPSGSQQMTLDDLDRVPSSGYRAFPGGVTAPAGQAGRSYLNEPPAPDDDRTTVLINRGRSSAYRPSRWRRRKVLVPAAALLVALVVVLVTVLVSGGPSWPPSVATMKSEISTACQNPDVMSEPGQVNFACAKSSQQILWVLALLSSSGDAHFSDQKTGRVGLVPIAPSQGTEVAWSLNLHHPYNPLNPIDSLEVAARAINNIVAGASVIGADGSPSVQPGLESYPANCLRYTGSSAVVSRTGFPTLCRQSVSTSAEQAALVEDVYEKWAVGAPAAQAEDAAVLFQNAGNPGDRQVQAILRQLPHTRL